jgi:hypothetical protein
VREEPTGRHVSGEVFLSLLGCTYVTTPYIFREFLGLPNLHIVRLISMEKKQSSACTANSTYLYIKKMEEDGLSILCFLARGHQETPD